MTEHFRVAEWQILEWERDYSPLNVRGELMKMHNWCEANPRRASKRKNWKRFVINWLNAEYAKVAHAQVQARMYARVGQHDGERQRPDYSKEIAEILERYPDLGRG